MTAPSLERIAAFVAGAQWWADLKGRQSVVTEADARKFLSMKTRVLGTWPADFVGRDFVRGAKQQEWMATGATMWQSDQRLAEKEAAKRFGDPDEDDERDEYLEYGDDFAETTT